MKKYYKKNQKGRLLLEIIAFLAMIMLITPVMLRQTVEKNLEVENTIIASQMKSLQISANNFIANNYEKIVKGEMVGTENFAASEGSVDGTVVVTLKLDNPEFESFLPDGFTNKNKLGGEYKIIVKKENVNLGGLDTPSISALIVGNSSSAINDKRGARISSMIGSNGGYTPSVYGKDINFDAVGGEGLWKLDTKDYVPDGVGSGKIVATTVVVGGQVSSNTPTTGGNFLWRTASSDPTHNRIGSDFSLGGNNIEWLKNIVSYEKYNNQYVGSSTYAPSNYEGIVRSGDTTFNDADGKPVTNYTLSLEGESLLKDVALGAYGGNSLSDILPPLSLKKIYSESGSSITAYAPGFDPDDKTASKCPVGYAPVVMVVPNIPEKAITYEPKDKIKQNTSDGETSGWSITGLPAGGNAYVYCKFVEDAFTGL